MRLDPTTMFLLILVIGIAAGLLFDRFAGPGWLTRQVAGSTRGMATSSLVGIAGAFIGYHVAVIIGILGAAALVAAAVGALVVLWLWRVIR